MTTKIELLNAHEADLRLHRLAYEIYENNMDAVEIVLAGIIDRGLDIAKILKKKIEEISALQVTLISVYINKANPIECHIVEEFSPTNKHIILVDDVANSGKTVLYALKPFLDSIPSKIQVAVLIDRKHKRYPIASDYIGLQLSTTLQENILVEVEKGKVKSAFIN